MYLTQSCCCFLQQKKKQKYGKTQPKTYEFVRKSNSIVVLKRFVNLILKFARNLRALLLCSLRSLMRLQKTATRQKNIRLLQKGVALKSFNFFFGQTHSEQFVPTQFHFHFTVSRILF